MVGEEFQIEIYDCTLRDGAQAEGVDFSVDSKAHIAGKLDNIARDFGSLVHFIEGGYPGSNPKDIGFFQRLKERPLKYTQLVPFGSTRYKSKTAKDDIGLKALLEAKTEFVTIFGKSWDFHVTRALQTELPNNLDMIRDSISYLKKEGRRVFFDAEHFFNGYIGNPSRGIEGNKQYALDTLVAASEAGAERLILCETNGGLLLFNHPEILQETVEFLRVKKGIDIPLGIHTHNDNGNAVANTLYVVNELAKLKEKLVQVQGCWNGFGERAGNADLCQIIPCLVENLGIKYTKEGALALLTEVSRYVYDMAGIVPQEKQPIVGTALSHKGGIHISAIKRDPGTYEWADLGKYGNPQGIVISDQAGKSAIYQKVKEFGLFKEAEGLGIDKEKYGADVLDHIKQMEHEGYSFRGANASLELLMRKRLARLSKQRYEPIFVVDEVRSIVNIRGGRADADTTLTMTVGKEQMYNTKKGVGPVDALDKSLRAMLEPVFPYIAEIRLVHFKSNEVSPKEGAESIIRVYVTTKDNQGHEWATVGASRNIIEASLIALRDTYEYGIRMYAPDQIKPQKK
ncbi:citramalate synthase [Candidatus Woesearchaeota archaeon]|nr:citramalate synthase [Candidatus Woesearchaeota archaeon]